MAVGAGQAHTGTRARQGRHVGRITRSLSTNARRQFYEVIGLVPESDVKDEDEGPGPRRCPAPIEPICDWRYVNLTHV